MLRIVRKGILGLTALLLLAVGCARKVPVPTEVAAVPAPAGLLVVKDVSGSVLGRPLNRPFGIGQDHRGALYVADFGNDRLIRFHKNLEPIAEAGGFGMALGLLGDPTFLTFDNGLNLMISEESARRISRFDADLQFVDAIEFSDPDDPLKFGRPSGVSFTEYGEVWVADREQNRIAVFNNVGQFDRFVGDYGHAGGQLINPEKIVRGRNQRFYVCDSGNERVVIYDLYGNFVLAITDPRLSYPIACAPDGRGIWILDGGRGKLFLATQTGEIVFEAGPNLPGATGQLRQPADIAVIGTDSLLITDSGNNRILLCLVLFEKGHSHP